MRAHLAVSRVARFFVAAGCVPGLILGTAITAAAQPADEHQQMEMGGSQIVLKAFGAVEWDTSELRNVHNSFTIGQLSLFVNAPISERISVLAEMVMESGTSTRVVTDLERLLLTYRHNDYFQISAGRYHTGIGFYNAAFHHGQYFDTAIGRPYVYRFEDEGGVLPVHDVGVSVRGAIPRTASSLHYVAEVGNGRDWTPEVADAAGGRDRNDAKATNVGLAFHPERWRGVEIGGSYYHDTVPFEASGSVAHDIGAVYVVYRKPSVELMAEWLSLTHRLDGGDRFVNNAGYVQVSKAWGIVRPYYRYDRQEVDPGTPFIGPLGSHTDHIVGMRLDPVERLGFKFQYERVDQGERHGIDGLRAQLVFVF